MTTATAQSVVNIILCGPVDPGADPVQIADALARLFQIEQAQAQQLLARVPTLIKRNLPEDKASAYINALHRIGLSARSDTSPRPLPSTPVIPAPPEVAPQQGTGTAATGLQLEAIEEKMDCPACNLRQPKRTLCQGCGADMPAMLAAAESARTEPMSGHLGAKASLLSPIGSGETQASQMPSELAASTETPAFWSVSLHGRLGRLRYLQYGLLTLLALLPPFLLFGPAGVNPGKSVSIIVLASASLWITYQHFRLLALRFHDLNYSGKYAAAIMVVQIALQGAQVKGTSPGLAVFAALFSFVVFVVTVFMPGTADENDYGSPAAPVNPLALGLTVIALAICSGVAINSFKSRLQSGEGLQARLNKEVEKINRQLPETKSGLRMDKATLENGTTIMYEMTILNAKSSDVDSKELRNNLLMEMQKQACNEPIVVKELKNGARFGYRIYGNDDIEIATLSFGKEDCNLQ